jgi:hypothetical protein
MHGSSRNPMSNPEPPAIAPVPPPEHASPPAADVPASFSSWPYVDRRETGDRRLRPTSVLRSLLGGGQRKRGRRRGEAENIYVDLYGRKDVGLIVLILLLNVLDAYFTLDYVKLKSGREANPVADALLQMGNDWFIYAKCLVVTLSLVFLLVHRTFRYVGVALWSLCVFYGLLLFYHLFLQIEYRFMHV